MGENNLTGTGGTIFFHGRGTFSETCTDRAQGVHGYGTTGLAKHYVPITGVDVLSDSAAANGGYMYIGGNATATISKCQIHDNEARENGGAFFVSSPAQLRLNSVMLRNNHAKLRGGAVFVNGDADGGKPALLRAENSIGLDNTANLVGDNIYSADNAVVKLQCGDLHVNSTNLTWFPTAEAGR